MPAIGGFVFKSIRYLQVDDLANHLLKPPRKYPVAMLGLSDKPAWKPLSHN